MKEEAGTEKWMARGKQGSQEGRGTGANERTDEGAGEGEEEAEWRDRIGGITTATTTAEMEIGSEEEATGGWS